MANSKVQMRQTVSDFEIGRLPALNTHQFYTSTMGERALQLEVIALFQKQMVSAQSPDCTMDTEFLAHTLRGAALAIGADEIAAIAGLLGEKSLSRPEFVHFLQQAELRFKAAVDSFLYQS